MHPFVFPCAQFTELHLKNVKDKYSSNASINVETITIATVYGLIFNYIFELSSLQQIVFKMRLKYSCLCTIHIGILKQ